jgi:cardiolipin synthase
MLATNLGKPRNMVQSSEHVAQTPSRVSPVSVPNLLTYARIIAVPAVVASFYIPGSAGPITALSIFVLAAITDFFDGYLARALHQQSALGRMLDPIADKLLVAAVLLVLVAEGTIGGWSLWAALIILMREILVSGLRESLAEVRVSVPVTRLAKWKTTAQMVAIAFLLISPADEAIVPYTAEIGLTLLWIAAILTLYTGYDYFRAGFRHLLRQDS